MRFKKSICRPISAPPDHPLCIGFFGRETWAELQNVWILGAWIPKIKPGFLLLINKPAPQAARRPSPMQLHHCCWYTPLKELCQPHQFGRIDRCRKRVNHLINQLMNNDGVCRAAPGFTGSVNYSLLISRPGEARGCSTNTVVIH